MRKQKKFCKEISCPLWGNCIHCEWRRENSCCYSCDDYFKKENCFYESYNMRTGDTSEFRDCSVERNLKFFMRKNKLKTSMSWTKLFLLRQN